MEHYGLFFLILIILLFTGIVLVLFQWMKSRTNIQILQTQNEQLAESKNELTQQIQQLTTERDKLLIQKSETHFENISLNQKLNDQKQEIEQLNRKLQKDFEILAQKILEEKSEKFTQQNQLNLTSLINPLKDKIKDFETKIETAHKESLQKNASLKQQIEDLSKLNERINQEANNLTRALKGDQKTQGNWGEIILERILERSGLQRNQEYFVQQSFSNTDRKRFQPDVIVKLPDNKSIIIDAKVSLVAFERYFNEENETQKAIELKSHLQSIRNHFKSLSIKEYQNIYELKTLDFVLMFIPIESAFATAIQNDTELFNEAFERNIVIVSPTTLLATMRTIASIWKYENQNRNALEIAKKGADLYDQFVSLTQEFTKLGNQIETVQKTYDSTLKKLTGQRNLIRKVEDLKKMGLNTSKSISENLLDQSDENAV